MDRFKLETYMHYDIEWQINQKAREGWMVLHVNSVTIGIEVKFYVLFCRAPEGQTMPLGFKVV